jgi:hypothetical protein
MSPNKEKLFLCDVDMAKSLILKSLEEMGMMNSSLPIDIHAAVVRAVAELAGHLAAKAGIPPTEVIGVMVYAYEFEFKQEGEVVH